jgi:hypothetical protein
MLSLSANSDFTTIYNESTLNPYYDLDAYGEKPDLWGVHAIDQMIENILLTEPFERIFNLGYASPLYFVLFENFSKLDELMTTIFDTIEYWVPIKINREEAEVEADEYNHTISFRIPYVSNDGLITSIFTRRIRK